MRVGPAAVVTIVVVAEAKMEHFAQFFQEIEGFVDSPPAGRGELSLELIA
jgi:hypothetical protein